MKQNRVAEDKSEVVRELPDACRDETSAVEFLERQRWGAEPRCPHCGFDTVYQMQDRSTGERNRRYLWRCQNCKQQFTVRIGTVFEDSRIPLRHWCYAFWAACASKKGVSALQIKRMTGLSYKSALFMMHRIRFAMSDEGRLEPMLRGTVEADETYVGGKPRNKGPHNKALRGRKHLAPVFVMVERNGDARARVLADVNARNLKATLKEYVSTRSRLMTDDSPLYHGPYREFEGGHETVNHSKKEYARGDVYTNTAESFNALLKRGIYGTFHAVSRKHLPLYVSEFQFRWNTRRVDDGARVVTAIRAAQGKRLMYRQPVE